MRLTLTLLCLLFASSALAEDGGFEDRPEPGEAFQHFFQRITRGGAFQGIRLDAPASFQAAFLPRIFRPAWQSRIDHAEKALTGAGVDLWLGWYATDRPLPLLDPRGSSLPSALTAAETELSRCRGRCRAWTALAAAPWSAVSTEEREALAWAYVTKAPLSAGRTLLELLGDQHGLTAAEALPRVDFRLLHSPDFAAAVRALGWTGPIYFRGITAPDPKNRGRFLILLDDDLLRKMTPFNRDLLQAMEYVGLLTHELSHVYQNIAAEKLGLDLSIGSPESALLVEGEAEWLAESALDEAGRAQDAPSPLALFSAEQGSEIVNREGQATQGNLFPYTVGLPFAAALFDLAPGAPAKAALRSAILRTISGAQSLAELLRQAAGR